MLVCVGFYTVSIAKEHCTICQPPEIFEVTAPIIPRDCEHKAYSHLGTQQTIREGQFRQHQKKLLRPSSTQPVPSRCAGCQLPELKATGF